MRKCVGALAGILLFSVAARAQAQAQPLPPLPPPAPDQPGDAPPPPPEYAQPLPPTYAPAPAPYPPPPPVVQYVEAPEPVHAPKYSLWAGGRLGFLGFGGYFYNNQQGEGETTGNFAGNGLSLGADIGARLGRRYVPYLFIEHGFMAQGHRFEGTSATSATDLMGIGFRYTAGDVNSAGFLSDLSVGIRSVTVKSGAESYTMSSLEYFRLGLGAEVRISTLFVLSPMATLSGGTMSDTSGNVHFSAAGSGDGITTPTYANGKNINDTRGYVIVGIHCGAHFDIFGK